MSATVQEVTQYAASCFECHWFGGMHDNNVAEELANEDADIHNKEFHSTSS